MFILIEGMNRNSWRRYATPNNLLNPVKSEGENTPVLTPRRGSVSRGKVKDKGSRVRVDGCIGVKGITVFFWVSQPPVATTSSPEAVRAVKLPEKE